MIDREFSRVRQKLGKLWSTNYGDLEAKSYPSKIPKSTFAEDHISALGGARHQIFTRAREWPSLASAHPNGDRDPPTIFFKGGQKLA